MITHENIKEAIENMAIYRSTPSFVVKENGLIPRGEQYLDTETSTLRVGCMIHFIFNFNPQSLEQSLDSACEWALAQVHSSIEKIAEGESLAIDYKHFRNVNLNKPPVTEVLVDWEEAERRQLKAYEFGKNYGTKAEDMLRDFSLESMRKQAEAWSSTLTRRHSPKLNYPLAMRRYLDAIPKYMLRNTTMVSPGPNATRHRIWLNKLKYNLENGETVKVLSCDDPWALLHSLKVIGYKEPTEAHRINEYDCIIKTIR